ncbi:MAG: translation elongation factor Ts [Deltaproteobacteria bacterium RIFOXYD2_FULL_66_9]|nr:MAG: translation elongation factor Ts [Deltaproteobacteria bacterium RIFOXYD2_FULL_66_9]
MQITSGMVKELREKTGAGLMDCKAALTASVGDMEAAIDHLRKKGLAAAAKKSSRIASEGVVCAHVEGNSGALVEVNCETDFVARTDDFVALAKEIAALVNAKAPRDVDEALLLPAGGGGHLGEKMVEAVAKIGEKISFRRFARLEPPAGKSGIVVPYIHAGGKIGVLVAVSGADRSNAAAAALAKDLAMQVAAANPTYVGRNDVPAAVIEREKSIYREQAKASGKPDKILDKIADGKLEKYFGDFCLVEQAFIKDPDRKVSQLLADAGKASGAAIAVCAFARFQVGEGLEKRSDDLAAEVAKQLGQG